MHRTTLSGQYLPTIIVQLHSAVQFRYAECKPPRSPISKEPLLTHVPFKSQGQQSNMNGYMELTENRNLDQFYVPGSSSLWTLLLLLLLFVLLCCATAVLAAEAAPPPLLANPKVAKSDKAVAKVFRPRPKQIFILLWTARRLHGTTMSSTPRSRNLQANPAGSQATVRSSSSKQSHIWKTYDHKSNNDNNRRTAASACTQNKIISRK